MNDESQQLANFTADPQAMNKNHQHQKQNGGVVATVNGENGDSAKKVVHFEPPGSAESAETQNSAASANHFNGDKNARDEHGNLLKQIADLEHEHVKLEQKLRNANDEKEYYKKHFRGEHPPPSPVQSNSSMYDDFGKELLMANRKKYQLESRARQLEIELRESQNRVGTLDQSLVNAEKLLWLEKERSATLERQQQQLHHELDELRAANEQLRRHLDTLRCGGILDDFGGPGTNYEILESATPNSDKLCQDYEQRLQELGELKTRVEWRLGEVIQQYHDTKWRLGEVEATLAHRDWQLHEAQNRIKQLEASVMTTPSAGQNDEIQRLREERAKLEWRLGEVNQWLSDAKWRNGELESESSHRSHLLDEAHHRIGELERRVETFKSDDSLRVENEHVRNRLSDLDKAWNDAKWRIGELEADLSGVRSSESSLRRTLEEAGDQRTKLEWRLGELNEWWNDAKWRIGELQDSLASTEQQLKVAHDELYRTTGKERRLTLTTPIVASDAKPSHSNGNGSVPVGKLMSLLSGGTFLVKKQPNEGRHRWNLLTFENTLGRDPNTQFQRVSFELNLANGAAAATGDVFLIGSFVNWECALMCSPMAGSRSRRGVWLELPPGRHEFRWLVDGRWTTSSNYPQLWNEHGQRNNFIDVTPPETAAANSQ